MTEILHNELAGAIGKCKGGSFPGAFLVHGQEMLVGQAAESLIVQLLDGAPRDLCCEVVDGLIENIPDVLAQMSTFSLMSDRKLVIFREAKLFEGRTDPERLVEQILDAYESQDLDHAAKSLESLCAHLQIDLEEGSRAASGSDLLRSLIARLGADGMNRLIQLAMVRRSRSTGVGSHLETLQAAIEKGFADHHHLIITVNAKVPKNLKFYKAIREHGWIIDCNVPMGERRMDRMAQESVMRQALEAALSAAGKRLQAGLFEKLSQLTGFDLRTFVGNVEKLIDYVGERNEITAEDVHNVLRRTKSDPVFELTNAVADRNLDQSLFYLHTLLEGGLFPLQILAALANQIRRLIIAKDFTMSPHGKGWTAGMGYAQFRDAVMPAIAAFDRHVHDLAGGWRPASDQEKKGKSGGSKGAPDIALAPNPNNPYPVYQTLLKSEKYSRQELLNALSLLNQTDLRLKSTGQNAVMVLKKTVIDICASRDG